jgi:VWFA-related protein
MRRIAIAALGILVTGSIVGRAQQPRASSNLVVVPVTVTDRSGRFVSSLDADQFEISAGGARRPIVQFSAGRVPLSLGILLDIGGNVKLGPTAGRPDDARWADMRRALELLVTRLDAADEVFLAVFNDRVAVAPWTQDHASILNEFDALRPGGGNAVLHAVQLVSPLFELAAHQRKVLLLISDGNDTMVPDALLAPGLYDKGDQSAFNAASRQIQRQQLIGATRTAIRGSAAIVYAIAARKDVRVDTTLLENLTTESGGRVESPHNPSQLLEAVRRISDELQSQYLLAFEPGRTDGGYHAIRVKMKDRRLRVRARAGYIAPPVPPK